MENLLLYLSDLSDHACNDPEVSILEWGSGGSTVYFTNFLAANDIPYSWLSLEYNRKWYDRIHQEISEDEASEIVLFDVGNTSLKQRSNPMDEYVSYPSTLKRKWDLILVDGRKRRRCLIEASKLLVPWGSAVLHDAQREYYHCAFEHFVHGEFLQPKLWVGRQYNPDKAILEV